MFVKAIEVAAQFTRPLHTIVRNYESMLVVPGAATLFFVNGEGCALTCAHVAQVLVAAEELGKKRQAFSDELAAGRTGAKRKQVLRELEKKYGLSRKAPFEVKNRFINCVEGPLDIEVAADQNLDVAIIRFRGFARLLTSSFPRFATDGSQLKQGKYLCRLGFPFAEFTNYQYNSSTDSIDWTETGTKQTPQFPIEGMVTRRLRGPDGNILGFEMSTPGLKGQSGGPVFDADGVVWGMQSRTAHLDLDFDVDQEVLRSGLKKKVTDSAFLHVGHCIHVDVLKRFMRDHGVSFQEA